VICQRVCESDGVKLLRHTSIAAAVLMAGILASCGGSDVSSTEGEAVPQTSTTVTEASTPTTTSPTPIATPAIEDDSASASDRAGERPQIVTTTTVPVPPAPVVDGDTLLLSRYGVGDHRFGDDADEVISLLSEVFGIPESDTMRRFTESESGEFVDRNGDYVFIDVLGRETCFVVGLCVESAGEANDEMVFTGWTHRGVTGALATSEGLGVGSRWSSFRSAMTVEPIGCGMYSTGMFRGIKLEVRSTTDSFTNEDVVTADPEDVVVVALSAGDVRTSLHPAC
jgi:hypothetical protein